MKVAFITFGCRLNRAESLDLEARYRAEGHSIVGEDAAPDLIIVRGCSVTAKAQRDCEKAIARLREDHPAAEVRILGCLPERDNGKPPAPPSKYVAPSGTSRAYLKVQDGCSGKCAFCIVPRFRGPPASEPFDELRARVESLMQSGYREIVLTGCNLALYRSGGRDFAALLDSLASMANGVARIRIGSLEPGVECKSVMDAIAVHANICRFLHLSLQSGSDRVLKRMRRPYGIELAENLCDDARERLGNDLSLGADVITGFPGESGDDFAATRDFLARHAFTNLHVFPFSERPGTPAAAMDGAVPRTVRIARARELSAFGNARREAFAQSFIGKEVEVCVERGGEHGWTEAYLPCKWKDSAERRSLVRKRVVAVEGCTLLA